ncbi:MAG: B12-binding domain-containing protein [Lacipirellulaceae bacterium]
MPLGKRRGLPQPLLPRPTAAGIVPSQSGRGMRDPRSRRPPPLCAAQMKELLSPKQVAASIGVSESSLKRWCDQGVLTTERTPGGHRRIRLGEVIRFLRERSQPLVHPELLGLPPGAGKGARSIAKATEALLEAVKAGDGEQARRLVLDLFLAGNGVVRICEELIAPVLRTIGDSWACGSLDVYHEHRASEILNRVLYELRQVLPPREQGAPLAIGGTPPGDNYRIATLMVELVLVDQGWNAMSLGSSLPFSSLTAAARRHTPALFWLSVSQASEGGDLRDGFAELLSAVPETTTIVLGGQQLDQTLGEGDPRVHRPGSLAALFDLLKTLRPARNSPDADSLAPSID